MDSVTVFCIVSIFLLVCVVRVSGQDAEYVTLLDGDVTIIGMFEVRSTKGGECTDSGDLDISSVMSLTAISWYLQKLNQANSLPLKLGFGAYRTCGHIQLAADAAISVLSRAMTSAASNASEETLIGIIGPKYSSESRVVSSMISALSEDKRFLQLSFASTATVLNDRQEYKNFYRVIPDDTIQIQAMIELMTSLQWNRIAIIYENDTYGRNGAEELKIQAKAHYICVSTIEAISIGDSREISSEQLKPLLRKFVSSSPAIKGIVYFGSKNVAKEVLRFTQELPYTDVPVYILSETNQLLTDIFRSDNGDIMGKVKGTHTVSAAYDEITEFTDYWKSLMMDITSLHQEASKNKYLYDAFQYFSNCDLRVNPACGSLTANQLSNKLQKQPVYVKYAITAAHTMVKAFQSVYTDICSPCENLETFQSRFLPYQMLDAIDGLTITFPDDFPNLNINSLSTSITFGDGGRGPGFTYEAYNFRMVPGQNEFDFVKVGTLDNGNFVINTGLVKDYDVSGSEKSFPYVRKGVCPIEAKCDECLPAKLSEQPLYKMGDIFIVGIASINNRNISGPLGCGTVRKRHGYQMFLSMMFGIEMFETEPVYNSFREKFGNRTVGLIVLNSCNNGLDIVRKILDLHENGLLLEDGTRMDVSHRILGYVGGQSTDVSEPAAVQLTQLKHLQISYSSTNPILSDKSKYPYFMRIVTPDNVQAKAMMSIVKKLGGEYIQLVYSEGGYGEGGRDSVIAEAKKEGICIVQTIKVAEREDYYEYFQHLKMKPHAKLVIIFLRSHVVEPFLQSLSSNMKRGDFQFIGSEAWGTNSDVLKIDISQGSITVALEMEKNLKLEQYIKDTVPHQTPPNYWLEEYIQNRQGCYLPWSFDKSPKFIKECKDTDYPKADVTFSSDAWCIFVLNTVLSILKGTSTFFYDKCGTGRDKSICFEYKDNPDKLVEVMKDVKMNLDGGTREVTIYDNLGDGSMGYTIFNIREVSDKTAREYNQVGRFVIGSEPSLATSDIKYPTDEPIISVCPNEQACQPCRAAREPDPERSTKEVADVDHTPTVILGIVLGIFAVTVIVLAYILWKKTRESNKEDPYITPTEVDRTTNVTDLKSLDYDNSLTQLNHGMPDFIDPVTDERF